MYDHRGIEAKWQAIWEKTKPYRTTDDSSKKFYVLDMFPYPSGAGLHVGHPEGYTATDIIARYKRLNGYDVLHPIGWDAFGLPAEQYAIQTGNAPAAFTQQNIDNFRRQLKALGFSFDYDKEVNTTDPAYYKWTQWIVLKLYDLGLAEIREIDVNWCEELGTVLANEEVVADAKGNPVSERGGYVVTKRPLKQWVLRITEYANRLYEDLSQVAYPDSLVALQQKWIKNEDGSLHLRDWVFSRQRYWGEPFPFAFDETGKVYPLRNLPVLLPEMTEIKSPGTGESPLANNKEWLHFKEKGKTLRHETNTMPQWAGSSWYYLAYIMRNADGTYTPLNSPEAYRRFEKWLPVDLYVGGQEHAVLHLLYARFWHKALFDAKVVPTSEPFFKIVNQGMILGPDNQKMSKSRGNVINPDEIVAQFGADTLRVYEMFMGPLEETKAWSTEAISGVRRWLDRVERLYDDVAQKHFKIVRIDATNKVLEGPYHALVKDVTADIEQLKFNLAISKLMVFVNLVYKAKVIYSVDLLIGLATILSTLAPHLGEELLAMLGAKAVVKQTWPQWDEAKLPQTIIVVAVQINGKLRATISFDKSPTKEAVIKLAKANATVAKHLVKKAIKRTIFVKDKTLNFVLDESDGQ